MKDDYYEEQGGRQVHDPFKYQKEEDPNVMGRVLAVVLIVGLIAAALIGISVVFNEDAPNAKPKPAETVVPQVNPPPIPNTTAKLQHLADQTVVLFANRDNDLAQQILFYHEETGECDLSYALGLIPDEPDKQIRQARAEVLAGLDKRFENVVTATVSFSEPVESDGHTASRGEILLGATC